MILILADWMDLLLLGALSSTLLAIFVSSRGVVLFRFDVFIFVFLCQYDCIHAYNYRNYYYNTQNISSFVIP